MLVRFYESLIDEMEERVNNSTERRVSYNLYDSVIENIVGDLENKETLILAVEYYYFLKQIYSVKITRHEGFVNFEIWW